jgi:AcrR family transcriptional regulator
LERISLRERKKTRTWENLVKISTRLFLEKGYDNTTVDEIVDQAELSQRTFFRYFPSKEAVLFRDFSKREQRLAELLSANADNVGPFERIKNAMDAMGDDYRVDREVLLAEYRIVSESRHLIALDLEQDSKLEALMASALHEWNGTVYLPRREADIAAGAIFGSIRSAMGHWFDSGCTVDLKEIKSDCFRVVDALADRFPVRR